MVPLLILVVVLGIAVAVAARWHAARRSRTTTTAAEADARRWYERLGADVSGLTDDGSVVVRQALSDASERYAAAGSDLASASTHQGFVLARRTALEGLYYARAARTALGLNPGPDLPPIEDDVPSGEPYVPQARLGSQQPSAGGLGGSVTAGIAGLGLGLLAGELLGGHTDRWGDDGDFGDFGDS